MELNAALSYQNGERGEGNYIIGFTVKHFHTALRWCFICIGTVIQHKYNDNQDLSKHKSHYKRQ